MRARFETAQHVADAVLYEGYVLYPYRASAQKNRIRFQWGVLVPPGYAEVDPSERTCSRTECLVETAGTKQVELRVRFLQLQRRSGDDGPPWDETVERTVDAAVPLADALAAERRIGFAFPGGREQERTDDGVVVRERWPVTGGLKVAAEPLPTPWGLARLRVEVENETAGGFTSREEALAGSLIATHVLLAVDGGGFVSLLDPPEWAKGFAAECDNQGTFPVLAGEADHHDVVLSSPIILYDHPTIAPESPGDMYDALEIDEILTLRTMALTDEEKREARATDPRAKAVIDRTDTMPAEVLDKLHGAMRYLRSVEGDGAPLAPVPPPDAPWWDPGADGSVSPETDTIRVGRVDVGRGAVVRLRPKPGRADAQDMFLTGRTARVEAVFFDVDGEGHLAVSLDDDPAADLLVAHGRFMYFSPDEVEVVAQKAAR